LSGCGTPQPDYGSLDLSTVTGKVTLNGEPLAGGLVIFEAGDLTFSYATTDGRGRYRLMFNSQRPGVTKGRKTVRIWSSRRAPGLAEAEGAEDEAHADRPARTSERVPPRYNDRSELTVTVERARETFDFALRSDPKSI
jgi:hypothetical protein